MKYTTVLFDLDGTLTDPAEGICKSIQYAMQQTGRTVEPLDAYHKYIGPPLIPSFEVFVGATPEEANELLMFYRERFSTVGLFENIPYPGMLELVQDLKKAGVHTAVATGKPTPFAERILEKFGFSPYIDFVSGSSLDETNTEKCGLISRALLKLGQAPSDACLMVGDRSHDAIGARMAKISFAGVLFGYGSREELEAEGAVNLVNSVDELRNFIFA